MQVFLKGVQRIRSLSTRGGDPGGSANVKKPTSWAKRWGGGGCTPQFFSIN